MVDDSELRMRYGYEGAEEEVSKGAAKAVLAKWAGIALKNPYVLGGIVVFAILFIFFVPAKYKLALAVGAVIGILISISKGKNFSWGGLISSVVICSLIAGAIIIFVVSFASPLLANIPQIYSQVKTGGVGERFYCMTHPNECYGEKAWETKTSQQIGTSTINVDWSNAIKRTPLDVVVPISVMTKEKLELTPVCLLDNKQIGTLVPYGNTLVFEKSDSLQQASVRCSTNDVTSDKLSLRLETPQEDSLSFIIWTGKGSSKGVLSKQEAGPYTIEVKSSDNMPFVAGKYPLTVDMKKTSDFVLSKIESFKMETISENIAISCPEIENKDKAALTSWLKEQDNYIFICDIDATKALESVEQNFITLSLKYTLEADYRTTLKSASV